MAIEVEIIADSISPSGARLTTYKLRMPRFILPEFSRHRALSLSVSSTRAIPTTRALESVRREPAMPLCWGANRKGMQADRELDRPRRVLAEGVWTRAAAAAVEYAAALEELGAHKQIAARVVEPFGWSEVVASATESGWMNYFTLRVHPATQPEHQALAVRMARAYRDSVPVPRELGHWHLPFVTDDERSDFPVPVLLAISAARCARTSYARDGVVRAVPVDCELHDRLIRDRHWSPLEHQATPMIDGYKWSGNFEGWSQHRKQYTAECARNFDWNLLDNIYGDRDYILPEAP